jgi:hypothetical protein
LDGLGGVAQVPDSIKQHLVEAGDLLCPFFNQRGHACRDALAQGRFVHFLVHQQSDRNGRVLFNQAAVSMHFSGTLPHIARQPPRYRKIRSQVVTALQMQLDVMEEPKILIGWLEPVVGEFVHVQRKKIAMYCPKREAWESLPPFP